MNGGRADSRLAPWPFHAEDEITAVAEVLRAGRVNYWTGDRGHAFEQAYAAHCGVKFGLAVANGTVALELALRGFGIGPGDDVIVPARTFVATAAAAALCGARPVAADIDPVSLNLTAATVAAVLTPRTKAVIPVHLYGWPVDMNPLLDLARQKSLIVIEDCAQAHGAADNGKPVGGIGHAGCFSFCQDKIISTGGEGGMVMTDDEAAYRRMWAYRDHGRDYALSQAPDPGEGFRWLTTDFGSNWRLTEPQAAIGLAQLGKLPQWVERRRAVAAMLAAALQPLAAATVHEPPRHSHHSYYKYVFRVNPEALRDGWSRDRIIAELESKGVPARVGGCPNIAREAAFARQGFLLTHAQPVADAVGARAVMLPVHPTLTDGNVAFMAETLRAVLTAAAR